MSAARSAFAAARRAVRSGVQRRNMSSGHSPEEEIAEMNKWKNVTYVVVPGCIALFVYDFSQPHAHSHSEKIAYPYMRIRNKEFPWGPDGLFEHKPKEHAKH